MRPVLLKVTCPVSAKPLCPEGYQWAQALMEDCLGMEAACYVVPPQKLADSLDDQTPNNMAV